MPAVLALLLLSLTVKQNGTVLRTGCSEDDSTVATLASGAPLTIRFALSGESVPCYKVAVESGGKTQEGYLPASAIDGLDDFDKSRRDAAWIDAAQVMSAFKASVPQASLTGDRSLARQATDLIETSQPARALELLEPELRRHKDPTLLAIAGFAAWRNDEGKRALEFWRSSLDIVPNPTVASLYRRVEHENQADQSTDKVYGLRVVLRYESGSIPVETARQMASVLDDEYLRISAQLGCNAGERIIAIAQSREAYRKTTDAAEWSGGQYDGRIRVPVFNGLDAQMPRTLAHETTHACLTMLGQWPSWLQEGLAQRMSGDTLSPAIRQKLSDLARQGQLPKLSKLSSDWSHLDTQHAILAYALSLAAVEMFFESYSQYGIANLLRNPDRMAQITADLDKRLGL